MSDTSPTTSITVCDSTNEEACRTSGNELGYNLYYNLGGPGTGDRSPFTNVSGAFWSGTEYSADYAWAIFFTDGFQQAFLKYPEAPGWAVRPGQCRAAPSPAQPVPAVGAWDLGVLGLLLMLLARARLR